MGTIHESASPSGMGHQPRSAGLSEMGDCQPGCPIYNGCNILKGVKAVDVDVVVGVAVLAGVGMIVVVVLWVTCCEASASLITNTACRHFRSPKVPFW